MPFRVTAAVPVMVSPTIVSRPASVVDPVLPVHEASSDRLRGSEIIAAAALDHVPEMFSDALDRPAFQEARRPRAATRC
jgi:hypothetical protein